MDPEKRKDMRDRFNRFMQGRYGNDRFNRVLMITALVCMVLSMFGLDVFYVIAIGLLAYAYYRMFSRKIYQRAAENQKFLQKEQKFRNWLNGQKRNIKQSKTHRIYKCPGCKQKIRVPRGRGKIEIRCQKCGTKFVKKS